MPRRMLIEVQGGIVQAVYRDFVWGGQLYLLDKDVTELGPIAPVKYLTERIQGNEMSGRLLPRDKDGGLWL